MSIPSNINWAYSLPVLGDMHAQLSQTGPARTGPVSFSSGVSLKPAAIHLAPLPACTSYVSGEETFSEETSGRDSD